MSSTYYSSLTGMLAAGYGLQNTSNNIANMQSPGFKRTDVFYSSLGNGSGDEGLGSGVRLSGTATNFSDGTLMQTESVTDLAIVGQGFFVVRMKNGDLLYTRSGQFGFEDGVLTDTHSGGEVQGINQAGNLVPIYEKGPKTTPGKPSKELFLNGQFVFKETPPEDANDKTKTPKDNDEGIYDRIKFDIDNVFDAHGKPHKITLEFKCIKGVQSEGDALTWEVASAECDGAYFSSPIGQRIVFGGDDGAIPKKDNSSISFSLNGKESLWLRFGDFGSGTDQAVKLEKSLLHPEGSKIAVFQNDGYGVGKQISFKFDENGQILYNYDNGQTVAGINVGMARFDEMEHTLVQKDNSMFHAKDQHGLHFGRPNENGFGSIKDKYLERSNVDSSKEFANIVILQRMFQACSQIMDIDKQLLEGLEAKS